MSLLGELLVLYARDRLDDSEHVSQLVTDVIMSCALHGVAVPLTILDLFDVAHTLVLAPCTRQHMRSSCHGFVLAQRCVHCLVMLDS